MMCGKPKSRKGTPECCLIPGKRHLLCKSMHRQTRQEWELRCNPQREAVQRRPCCNRIHGCAAEERKGLLTGVWILGAQ